MQMVGGNDGNQFRQYVWKNIRNQNRYNAIQNVGNQIVQNTVQNLGIQNVRNQNWLIVVLGNDNPNANQNGNGNVVAARAEGIELQSQEKEMLLFLDSVVNRSKGRDGSAEVHEYDNCYNNEIFNMFTQEDQDTKLLIFEPHQVQQNDSNVIYAVFSVEQSGGIVEQNLETVEKTRACFESLYNNLAIEVEKVNTVNRKMKETNADLTTELTRYKNKKNVLKLIKKNTISLKDVTKIPFIKTTQASLKRSLFHFSRRSTRFYQLSDSEIVDIEKVAVCFSLRS
nr:hypothetical protein [Tanacetum cinerariifolium]GEW46379.1 hypothetical protein [Tanacetum cinerariifolium]